MGENLREKYPEKGELVIATVKSIFRQGAFLTLDEYDNKVGMLPLSEISLKWVRNIRDYVKEGQRVVVLVLRVNPKRGHIDLSLRRVSDAQRKEKLQDVKQRQRAEKLMEFLAKELKLSIGDVNKRIGEKILKKFDSLYSGFEAISADKKLVDKLGIEKKLKKPLIDIVSKTIKAPFVDITGYVELKSYEPDGVDILKEALHRIKDYKTRCRVDVSYISAPRYRIKVTARDYKTAERVLRESAQKGITYVKEHGGDGEFYRKK